MRLVFAGTPAPAVPSLRALVESRHEVVGVLTRPDAPSGRGRRLTPSPVAEFALDSGLPLLRPQNPKEPDFLAELERLQPEACPVVAYGAILPQAALDIATHGWINLHFSLLPAWRGAAPVQHSIWHGDEITGASTFLLEADLDTGPVFGVVTEEIRADDTTGSLLARLADSGSQLLVATLDGIEAGALVAVAQPSEGVSFAPKITVADAEIDWELPATAVDRMVRACTPAPGAWTTFRTERMKLGPMRHVDEADGYLPRPGEVVVAKRSVRVGCATGVLELGTVRAPGKRELMAADWARGSRVQSGELMS